MQEVGHGGGAALSALRQHAERRGRAEEARGARARRGGRACCRAGWARRRARCWRCSVPAITCSRAATSMAARARLLTEEFTSLGHRRHARRSVRGARLAEAAAQGDARRLPRVAGEPDVPRARPAAAVSYLTHESGLALVVDSTFASPINLRPLEHGADVVIHSATKFLNGHHDVMGGVVLRHGVVRRGSAAEDDHVGPGARSVRVLAAGARAQDARRARQAAERERDADRAVVRRRGRRCGRCTIRGSRTHPDHEVAAGPDGRLRRACWRWSWPAGAGPRTDSCES